MLAAGQGPTKVTTGYVGVTSVAFSPSDVQAVSGNRQLLETFKTSGSFAFGDTFLPHHLITYPPTQLPTKGSPCHTYFHRQEMLMIRFVLSWHMGFFRLFHYPSWWG